MTFDKDKKERRERGSSFPRGSKDFKRWSWTGSEKGKSPQKRIPYFPSKENGLWDLFSLLSDGGGKVTLMARERMGGGRLFMEMGREKVDQVKECDRNKKGSKRVDW